MQKSAQAPHRGSAYRREARIAGPCGDRADGDTSIMSCSRGKASIGHPRHRVITHASPNALSCPQRMFQDLGSPHPSTANLGPVAHRGASRAPHLEAWPGGTPPGHAFGPVDRRDVRSAGRSSKHARCERISGGVVRADVQMRAGAPACSAEPPVVNMDGSTRSPRGAARGMQAELLPVLTTQRRASCFAAR